MSREHWKKLADELARCDSDNFAVPAARAAQALIDACAELDAAEARCAAYREALDNMEAHLAPDFDGRRRRNAADHALGILMDAKSDHDHAAEALLARLRAAEEAIGHAATFFKIERTGPRFYSPISRAADKFWAAMEAWREMKGSAP